VMQLWTGNCRTTVDAGAFLTAAVTNESEELQKSRMKRRDSALSKWHTLNGKGTKGVDDDVG